MRRGDPRLPLAEQIRPLGLEDWAKRLIVRLYDRFREIDDDIQRKYQYPNSVTLTAGTSTSAVADLKTPLDGLVYHIDEAAATPGILLEVGFINVSEFSTVQTRFYYDGTGSHVMKIEMRNYSTSAWDVMETNIGDTGSYVTVNWIVPGVAGNYVDSSKNAAVRFNHVTGGSAAHNLDIDYVVLVR